ncbi:hypothetical protein DV735_g2694, partial [Chaetothyriales sp. CBS 134920]
MRSKTMSLRQTGIVDRPHLPELSASPPFQSRKKNILTIKSADGKVITPAPTRASAQSGSASATTVVHGSSVTAAATSLPLRTSLSTASADTQPNQFSANLAKLSMLNIYAPIHVPDWVAAINESVATPVQCLQLPHFNAREYASQTGADIHVDPLQSAPVTLGEQDNHVWSALELDSYDSYFSSRLQSEVRALDLQLMQHSLFQHPIILKNRRDMLYQVQVPGLRENAPRVEIGDIVLVRPIYAQPAVAAAEANKRWRRDLQHHNIRHPAFLGIEYRAVVWGVHRASETIMLRIDATVPLPSTANLRFVVQSQHAEALLRAVQTTHRSFATSSLLRSMLFPDQSDAVMQTKLSPAEFEITWDDTCLNFEQQKAVASIVADNYGSVPYLISGPPGTGKTRTIVETALQLLARNKSGVSPHILICTPSDSAADSLAILLSDHLGKDQMLRLNAWTRSYAEVPDKLMLYSYSTDNSTFSLPPFRQLMSYSVVITTCRDASMLVEARLTNKDLAQLAFNSLAAVSPLAAENLKSPLLHWTALLFDEAAQATEPESLIPLSVTLPLWSPPSCPLVYPQFVLAGDEFQLGPRVASHGQNTGLGTSLFQRLFNRAFYANHPLSRANGSPPLTRGLLPLPRPAFTNLIRNYRSHPAILSVPSSLFYYDTLTAESPITSDPGEVSAWPGWQKPNWPVLFLQNSGPDEVDDILTGDGTGAGSLYNTDEVMLVSHTVHSLLEQIPGLAREEIVIMSPFRAQVARIRTVLREAGLAAVNVGPLEAFQGLESRIDHARGLGVIDEPKRFNVALTRAMEGLIVIGDAATLTITGDQCWRSFIAFCSRNGLVGGGGPATTAEDLAGQRDAGLIPPFPPGRLERALRQRDTDAQSPPPQRVIGLRGFVEDIEEGGEIY